MLKETAKIDRGDPASVRRLPRSVRKALTFSDKIQKQVAELPKNETPAISRSRLRTITTAVQRLALELERQSERHRIRHEELLKKLNSARAKIRYTELRATELKTRLRREREGLAEKEKESKRNTPKFEGNVRFF